MCLLLFVVVCAVVVVLCCLFMFLCLWCFVFLFPTMPHVPLQVNNEHNKHNKTQNKTNVYVFVVVWCCLLLLVCLLWCLFMFLCYVCVALSCFQQCRMFLYMLITNITSITKHKTKQQIYIWFCCRLLLVGLFVLLWCLFMYVCLFCVAFSCFQLCRMFLYRLITNITNITKHTTTKKHVCGCCCLLLVVLVVFVVVCSLLCVCVVLLFLVSNYAACFFIG